MKFDEYQDKARKYDSFKHESGERWGNLADPAFVEKILGLAGEAGETVDKVKKIIRDKGGVASSEDVEVIKKELGDVLWYIANLSTYLDISLLDVAKTNLAKLESRYQRNLIHGEGDNR